MIRRVQPTTNCVSSLLGLFQNELSLEKLTLEEIVCDKTYYYFKKANEVKPTFYVEFDIRSGDISFNEWISHLKPVTSEPDFVRSSVREDQG
jgi:hypothetical protein